MSLFHRPGLAAAALLAALAYGSPLPLGGPPPFIAPGRRRGRRRGPTIKHMVAERLGMDRKRLPIATGPGSISAKSELFRLCRQGRLRAADELIAAHQRQCGERLTRPAVLPNHT